MDNPRNVIGPQLRRIRTVKGLSQPKLAEVLQRKGWDTSRDVIAKIEGQTRWVADFEVAFIAEVLQVHLDELFPRHRRTSTIQEFVGRLERPLM
jgi:transcriptional regulator with XRE-family HTH domain